MVVASDEDSPGRRESDTVYGFLVNGGEWYGIRGSLEEVPRSAEVFSIPGERLDAFLDITRSYCRGETNLFGFRKMVSRAIRKARDYVE